MLSMVAANHSGGEFVRVQRHPCFYAAPVTRDRQVVQVFNKMSNDPQLIQGERVRHYLDRSSSLGSYPASQIPEELRTGHFYQVTGRETGLMPPQFAGIVPQKAGRIKEVSLFADVTVLHNTGRLEDFDPARQFGDNPMLALDRLHGRAFALMDGQRNLVEIFSTLMSEYGSLVNEADLVAFVYDLERLGFLRRTGNDYLADQEVGYSTRLRPWDLNIARVQSQFTYTELPLYVLLELTYTCNMACRTCYTQAFKPIADDLGAGAFLDLVLDPVIKSGVSYVTLMGGEPLLRKDLLVKTITRLRASDVYTKLITNGYLLQEMALADELDASGINRVELSLDGFDKEANDRIRGSGTYERIVRAIDLVRATRIPQVGLSVTIKQCNFEAVMAGLPDFVRQHRVDKVYFSRYYACFPANRGGELTQDQRWQLYNKCQEWEDSLGREIPHFEAVVLGNECTCGRSSVVINPWGGLKSCPFTTLTDESLLSGRNLADIWEHSDAFWKIRALDRGACSTRNFRDVGRLEG